MLLNPGDKCKIKVNGLRMAKVRFPHPSGEGTYIDTVPLPTTEFECVVVKHTHGFIQVKKSFLGYYHDGEFRLHYNQYQLVK